MTTCLGGVYTGIEKYEYEDTVTLTGSCRLNFYHDEATNSSTTTILNPSSSNLTVYCLINNLDASVNSSPTFLSPPILFLNLGHQNCNVPGAYDADGDLLNFQIITPLTGMNVSGQVTFLSGYSASQPVISSPPCTFNSVSGEFCCTPSTTRRICFDVLFQNSETED
ncbi:MAG: hypothetical protein IPP51_15425 [Bacteroidetes bacterium]|nr:hypothetical protein [Bacteroidota bacterium]